RREKYVPRGGPDGGDGGRGGDVVLVSSEQVRDLAGFTRRIHYRAPAGGHGRGAGRHGADGRTLRVVVPPGTEIRTLDEELLADLVEPGSAVVVAEGGEGGRGNRCFVSSTRRAPHFAERGLAGQERWLLLHMKLLADVGLVGAPNAGKSSLLAALTRARPKIAAYPFTTIEPNLGVLALDDGRTLVLADIPGLIEGASEGVGLGHEFLAHIERTRALVYVADASHGEETARSDLRTLHAELAAFQPALARRPRIVAFSKVDLDAGAWARDLEGSQDVGFGAACPVVAVSNASGAGLSMLVDAMQRALPPVGESAPEVLRPVPVLRPGGDRTADFVVVREGRSWRVRGAALERLVAKADLENEEAVAYLQQVMERAGVSTALRRAGAEPGAAVLVGEREFELF
ncbi:MAG: GTPase ObgE, partial [Actinobacteria bacterium]|nr:GTPase ObgE [Actinomycetota bacterium]